MFKGISRGFSKIGSEIRKNRESKANYKLAKSKAKSEVIKAKTERDKSRSEQYYKTKRNKQRMNAIVRATANIAGSQVLTSPNSVKNVTDSWNSIINDPETTIPNSGTSSNPAESTTNPDFSYRG